MVGRCYWKFADFKTFWQMLLMQGDYSENSVNYKHVLQENALDIKKHWLYWTNLISTRSQLKIFVEESVKVLYLIIELVLAEVGFSSRRGFTATTVHTAAAITSIAAARKRECHTNDYRTQYRNPKSHLSIVWHKDNQNQGNLTNMWIWVVLLYWNLKLAH